jgi:hypothetical protein
MQNEEGPGKATQSHIKATPKPVDTELPIKGEA